MSALPAMAGLFEGARRATLHVSRLALTLLCLASAAYCLLSHVPFSNQALFERGGSPSVQLFVALQPWLFVLLSAAVVATTLPRYRFGRSKGWSVVMAISLGGFAIWMIVAGPLANAATDGANLARASWMLVPLAVVGFFDVLDASRRVIWVSSRGAESARQFQSLVAAALAVTIVFFMAGVVRGPGGTLRAAEGLAVGFTAFWSQLVLAACAFIGLAFARAAASFAYRSAFWEAVIVAALGAIVFAKALVTIVLLPLAVEGVDAWVFAISAGASLALLVYGTGIRHRALLESPEIESGVDVVVAGLGLVPRISRPVLVAATFGLVIVVWGAAVKLAAVDWEFVLQRLLVVATWIAFTMVFYRLIPPRDPAPDGTIVWLEVCVLVLGGHYAFDQLRSGVPVSAAAGSLDGAAAQWRSRDAGFRLANDAISLSRRYPDEEFYALLRDRSNLSRRNAIEPVAVGQVDRLGELVAPRPNIFIVTIDGLRRDQVGAAGAGSTLTPEIDLLAREGVSFRNAFTRYGAVGMAEPSIWLGGMTLHESYVEPFDPMNALQRLLESGRYREFLGDGPILKSLVRDGPSITRLQQGPDGGDVCAQIEKLEATLEPFAGGTEPVFAYLHQPDLRDGLRREGLDTTLDGVVPGTSRSLAKRLSRVEACHGGFFDFVRSKAMWDSSIVIVTSDRGDTSGPHGTREGAYSLVPDLLRVPLVIKLARDQRSAYRADPDAIAFTSDITPTLYYLLGLRPIRNSDFLGRPLFTVELREQLPYIRGDYLVASGYGPVYGILAENGRRLYVADAINARDTVYEIPRDGAPSARDPEPGESRRAHALMREKLKAIGELYRFPPEGRGTN